MRRSQRLITAAVLVALSSALAGCGSTGGFEPSDLLDWMDTKKKLPGQRKPVFPEGVPGVQQGVPRELYKGSAELQQQQQEALPQPVQPAAEPARGRGTAPRRGSVNVGAVQEGAPAVAEDGTAAPSAQKPKKPVRRRTTAPPPDDASVEQAAPAPVQQRTAPQVQSTQPAASPFPAPLPSGSFQR